jgi:hypothetical protein
MGDFYEDFLHLNVRGVPMTDGGPERASAENTPDIPMMQEIDGCYIFAASISPETMPVGEAQASGLTVNSVYDIAGARFALERLIETVNIMEKHGIGAPEGVKGWTQKDIGLWQELLDGLPGYALNAHGAIAEWVWPGLKDRIEYGHRHFSSAMPLWFREINYENNPLIVNGLREFLRRKTENPRFTNAGHGILHAGLVAVATNETDILRTLLLRFPRENYFYTGLATDHYDSSLNPNAQSFCTDVANGLPALLTEMLVSTERDNVTGNGRIELLPALPPEFTTGSVKGLMGRNRFVISDLSWSLDESVADITFVSAINQTLTLVYRGGIKQIEAACGDVTLQSLSRTAWNADVSAGQTVKLRVVMDKKCI